MRRTSHLRRWSKIESGRLVDGGVSSAKAEVRRECVRREDDVMVQECSSGAGVERAKGSHRVLFLWRGR